MEALEAILTRRCVRNFAPTRIPSEELLEKVAEAGTFAPSGMGRQAGLIVKLYNREYRDRFAVLNAQIMGSEDDPFYGAPLLLIVFADRRQATYIYDGTLIMGNMMLAAHALGLGSCWVHRAREIFASDEGKKFMQDNGIEDFYEGIGFLALGYLAGEPRQAAPRKAGFIREVR